MKLKKIPKNSRLVSEIKNEQLHLFPVLLPVIISPPCFVCFGDSVTHYNMFTSKNQPQKKNKKLKKKKINRAEVKGKQKRWELRTCENLRTLITTTTTTALQACCECRKIKCSALHLCYNDLHKRFPQARITKYSLRKKNHFTFQYNSAL